MFSLLMVLIFAVGCGNTTSRLPTLALTATSIPPSESTTTIEMVDQAETVTPEPSALPPTSLNGKIILVRSDQDNSSLGRELEGFLSASIYGGELDLEIKPTLHVAEIQPDWRVIVLLKADENLPAAIAAAPETQFVVFSNVDLGMTETLNVIRLQPEKQAFTAGYLSVLMAPDWRAAGLLPESGSRAGVLYPSYRLGGGYFCGICNSFYAPIVNFPMGVQIPVSEDPAYWSSRIEEAHANVIYLMYLDTEIMKPALIEYVTTKGYILMGGDTPENGLPEKWAVTIKEDAITPFTEIWAAVVNGEGGNIKNAQIKLTDINTAYLTEGKQKLVQEMLDDLNAGLISPSLIQ